MDATTLMQRVAICFAAAAVGALAVILFNHLLYRLGVCAAMGVKDPAPLRSPDMYKPLFWGALWGIPLGLVIKEMWGQLYLWGFLYFLAPVAALFLFFLPAAGAGLFGLKQGGWKFTLYLLLVNTPFGIVTVLVAEAIIGARP